MRAFILIVVNGGDWSLVIELMFQFNLLVYSKVKNVVTKYFVVSFSISVTSSRTQIDLSFNEIDNFTS